MLCVVIAIDLKDWCLTGQVKLTNFRNACNTWHYIKNVFDLSWFRFYLAGLTTTGAGCNSFATGLLFVSSKIGNKESLLIITVLE